MTTLQKRIAERPVYLYQPVAGAGAWPQMAPLGTMSEAKAAVAKLRKNWPEAEVERILLVGMSGRRYWRWRASRWRLTTDPRFYDPTQKDLSRWA